MKTTLMVLTISGILFGCKKEKDNSPGCPVTMENLSGSYKVKALQYKSDASATPTDFLVYMDDCEKDNILNLKSDGTYKEDDNGTVCETDEAAGGTWQLHVNLLVSEGKLNGTIASWDCKTLVYYLENALKPGDRLTYTLEKQ